MYIRKILYALSKIIISYIMIFFNWRKLNVVLRTSGTNWTVVALLILIAVNSGCNHSLNAPTGYTTSAKIAIEAASPSSSPEGIPLHGSAPTESASVPALNLSMTQQSANKADDRKLINANIVKLVDVDSMDVEEHVPSPYYKTAKVQPEFVPVLMYHHFAANSQSYTTVMATDFEEQMSYFNKEHYTTITTSELETYLRTGTGMPEKPILITIDDGYESNYTFAFPILKKYNMKATIYVIVERMGKNQNNLQRLSWAQAKEMQDTGLIDIQTHSYNLHHQVPVKGKQTPAILVPIRNEDGFMENHEEYITRIKDDLLLSKQLIEKNVGNKVKSFCYPYGSYNDELTTVMKELGFKTVITTKEGVEEAGESPYEIQRINVNGGYKSENILKAIQQAKKHDINIQEKK